MAAAAAAAQRSHSVVDRLVLEDLMESTARERPSTSTSLHPPRHHDPPRGSNRDGTLRWVAGSPPPPASSHAQGEADRDFRRLAEGRATPRLATTTKGRSKPHRHDADELDSGGGRAGKSTRAPPARGARGSRSHPRTGKKGRGGGRQTELHFDRLQLEAARRGRGTVEVSQQRNSPILRTALPCTATTMSCIASQRSASQRSAARPLHTPPRLPRTPHNTLRCTLMVRVCVFCVTITSALAAIYQLTHGRCSQPVTRNNIGHTWGCAPTLSFPRLKLSSSLLSS
jgi:hypothetical protein